MKRLLGYKKKIVSLMCAVMIVSIGILSTSFDSRASGYYEFYINCAEPSTSSTQGYVVLILRNVSTGELVPTTFFWNVGVVVTSSGEDSYGYADVTLGNSGSSASISVAPAGHLNVGASALYTLYEIETSGRFQLQRHSSSERFNFTWNGYNIVSYKTSGNGYIHGVNAQNEYLCNVFFNEDNVSMLLMELQAQLSSSMVVEQNILNRVNDILNSVDGLENQLSSVISYLQSVDSKLSSISSQLQNIYNKADEILNEQKKTNTWLGKIWDSIQEFINPSDNDSQKTDEYNNETNNQKTEIDDLNEQNQTEKVDVDSAMSDVDANINYDDMAQYGGVLATITNNEYILQLILVVVSISIIAYVLFGKR